jgi:hypothetical protein
MFKNRSTGEILVIMVGVTVCTYVFFGMGLIILLAFFTDKDVSDSARNIADIINTLIGLLAGYLAGKTDTAVIKKELEKSQEKPKEIE